MECISVDFNNGVKIFNAQAFLKFNCWWGISNRWFLINENFKLIKIIAKFCVVWGWIFQILSKNQFLFLKDFVSFIVAKFFYSFLLFCMKVGYKVIRNVVNSCEEANIIILIVLRFFLLCLWFGLLIILSASVSLFHVERKLSLLCISVFRLRPLVNFSGLVLLSVQNVGNFDFEWFRYFYGRGLTILYMHYYEYRILCLLYK